MGLLAPLYALAALAIVGPVLFHLIRRQPQGQVTFSSLMFLSPSPPRLTRRSRLDNWLLLLLRALALVLIAFAFTRPYFRQESWLDVGLSGRTVVLLVDTSASMQRPSVWQGAQDQALELLDRMSPQDRVALYTVDRSLSSLVSTEEALATEPLATQQSVRAALLSLQPSWYSTELAKGITAVADALNAAVISRDEDRSQEREIVLISDLHRDSHLEPLQGYQWPEGIELEVRQVRPDLPGNARPAVMVGVEEIEDRDAPVRVRLETTVDSTQDAFELSWVDQAGSHMGTGTSLQVPPGQVRVATIGVRPPGAVRIRLEGDAWDGDNELFLTASTRRSEKIVVASPAHNERLAEERLSFLLERAPLDSPQVERRIWQAPGESAAIGMLGDANVAAIIIEPAEFELAGVDRLREFASNGGVVLVSLMREEIGASNSGEFLSRLLAIEGITVGEAKVDDFALMSAIDYSHPVFAPFADPRFNDFSKIRFWQHRQISLPEAQTPSLPDKFKVVAQYDDQSPLLIQQPIGQGSIWVFTSGWQPKMSNLGLSSKFVPIMMGILAPETRKSQPRAAYEVGEPIVGVDAADVRIEDSEHQPARDDCYVVEQNSLHFAKPGLYWIESASGKEQVAVQVPAAESQVLPLDQNVLEQYSVVLGEVEAEADRQQDARQLKVEELENKQRLWQWLLVLGLCVLALETVVAGRLAHRSKGFAGRPSSISG
ncbi:BatA domain-containing protein [Aureliella helgolandensis]|uniref:VWFA domain-containing protein n=1 Tax=Aureliella helgolandensis TaxID=2527968 RepID=A0A518GC36_9BACT|nr:BatA domain-containing protein [Aureliella helgolandensis]QDV26158.1 hypothetical protein Q31a_45300 [Aureliella helgolandensis]